MIIPVPSPVTRTAFYKIAFCESIPLGGRYTGAQMDAVWGSALEADAEIVIEDEGEKKYIFAQWNSDDEETIHFWVTEESLFDMHAALHENSADHGKICEIREEIRRVEDTSYCYPEYQEHYEMLLKMIRDVMIWNNVDPYDSFVDFDEAGYKEAVKRSLNKMLEEEGGE